MVTPQRAARVVAFYGITSVIEGKFIVQGIHCQGQDGGKLVDGDGNVIAEFNGEGSIPFYTKFMVDGMAKTSGITSDMYVYLDSSEDGGGE